MCLGVHWVSSVECWSKRPLLSKNHQSCVSWVFSSQHVWLRGRTCTGTKRGLLEQGEPSCQSLTPEPQHPKTILPQPYNVESWFLSGILPSTKLGPSLRRLGRGTSQTNVVPRILMGGIRIGSGKSSEGFQKAVRTASIPLFAKMLAAKLRTIDGPQKNQVGVLHDYGETSQNLGLPHKKSGSSIIPM